MSFIQFIGLLVFLGFYLFVLGGSFLFMWKLRVFSNETLIQAPQRSNTLSIIHIVVVLLVYIISTFALVGILQAAGYQISDTSQKASTEELLNSVLMLLNDSIELITLAVILFTAQSVFIGGISTMGLTWRGLPRGVGMGVLAYLLLMPLIFLTAFMSLGINSIMTGKPPPEHPLLQDLQNHPSVLNIALSILTACVIAPIAEEIFFRGLVQTWLRRLISVIRASSTPQPVQIINPTGVNPAPLPVTQVNPSPIEPRDRWLAIIITAALFACVHITLEGAASLAPLFVLAIGLGYVYERTGNIWTNITMHACFNTIGIVVTLLPWGN